MTTAVSSLWARCAIRLMVCTGFLPLGPTWAIRAARGPVIGQTAIPGRSTKEKKLRLSLMPAGSARRLHGRSDLGVINV